MKVKFSRESLWLLLVTSTFASGLIGAVRAAEIRVPYDYPTIQAAIDAASSGDVIIVSEGTYAEGQINVYKPLILIADGLVIVDGLGEGQVFYVTANSVTVRGFTVKNSKRPGLYSGIHLEKVQNCKIEANTATENSWAGINLFDSSYNVVEQNKVTHTFGGAGIALIYSSSNIIEANTGANNIVGIGAIRQSNDNVYEGNTVTHNFMGIEIHDSHFNKVEGNTVTNNAMTGIWCVHSDINKVEGNTAIDNGWSGIDLHYSDDNVIMENIVTYNTQNGIEIWRSHGNAVKENEALGNGEFDLCWDGQGIGNIWEENTFETKNWVNS